MSKSYSGYFVAAGKAIKHNWQLLFGIVISIVIVAGGVLGGPDQLKSRQKYIEVDNKLNNFPKSYTFVEKIAYQKSLLYQKYRDNSASVINSQIYMDVRSLEAAEQAAIWTKYGVYIGAAGNILIVAAFVASIWQNTLTRRAYIAAHRPRLRFRNAQLKKLVANEPVEVTISFVNVGDTDAITFRCVFDCMIMTDLGVITPFNGTTAEIPKKTRILPGQVWMPQIVCEAIFSEMQIVAINSGVAKFHVGGTILYKDGNGTVRFTDILRVYEPSKKAFIATRDGRMPDDGDCES